MSEKMLSRLLSARSNATVCLAVLLAFLSYAPNLVGQIVPRSIPRRRPAQNAVTTEIYIVTFRPGTSASQRAAIVQGAGAVLRVNYNITNAASVQVPNVNVLARLRNDPRIVAVFTNRPITLHAAQGRGGGSGGGGGGSATSKPKAPTSLVATPQSSSVISLAWTDTANNEDGFTVERCNGSRCSNFSQIVTVGANVTSYSNTGLTANTTYRYRVSAFNTAGSSKYSNTATATTLPPPPPAAPSNLTLQVVSSSQINLAWVDNSSDENGFQIERCQGTVASCGSFVQIVQVGANVTSYNNTGLSGATAYTYRVRAFNAVGNSQYSNSAEATTPSVPPPPPPAAPSNLTLQVVSYSQINLAWVDNSSDEGGFWVERCQGTVASCNGASFVQIAQVGANVTSFNNTGLSAQTTYTYRVRAFNAGGASSYSNPNQETTPSAPPSSQVVPGGVARIGAAPGALNWTGAGVGVAVVDTGLDFAHPDLGLNPEVIGVNSFNSFGGSCQYIHGHGTHVAGIIAARNNTIGVVGVAPNATLYCVNVFRPDPVYEVAATDESLIAGLEWIAANANLVSPPIRVVNMSLGREKTPEDTPDHPLHVIVKALYDSGISVVVSAGNDPLREVSQEVPAGYPEAMAIASTTAVDGLNGYDDLFVPCTSEQNIRADTASYFTTDGAFVGGTGVTVSAPGEEREDIYSYFGACYLEPIGILSTWPGGETIELYGTSMAAPHVAGVVALMWQKELSLGLSLAPEVARSRIRNSVARPGTAPLDSPLLEYSFDGQREGEVWAPAAVGDAPPPPPDYPPTVAITSPTTGSTFSAGAIINFAGTASDAKDGNLTNSLVWTSSRDGQIGTGGNFSRTLSSGTHTITATVTDSGGNVASASVSVTVGSPTQPTAAIVSSILYGMLGPNLLVTVELDNEFGGAVAGAAVSVEMYEWLWGNGPWNANGTTDAQGKVQFQLSNAPWGCYITTVKSVVANGLTWNGVTPQNSFCN